MKKFLLVCLLLGVIVNTTHAQKTDRNKRDSLAAGYKTNKIKQLFSLSPEQEKALYRAGIFAQKVKRTVFEKYWKTDSFSYKLAQSQKLTDSVYRTILGDQRFGVYKDSLYRREVLNDKDKRLAPAPSPSPKTSSNP